MDDDELVTLTAKVPRSMFLDLEHLGGNRSEHVRKAIADYLAEQLGRPLTDHELARALSIVFRAAQARRGEDVQ